MIKHLYKTGKHALMIALAFVTTYPLAAQPSVNGAQCIIPGITYQYNIQYNEADAAATKLCVTGGTLVNGSTCTPDSASPSVIFITWKDTAQHRINVLSPGGNTSFSVRATTALTGGLLVDSKKTQLYDSIIAQYIFLCQPATGGSCTPNYVYQWQKSQDGLTWADMENATGRDLVFAAQVTSSIYFRRVTTETQSNTIAYSETGAVLVKIKRRR